MESVGSMLVWSMPGIVAVAPDDELAAVELVEVGVSLPHAAMRKVEASASAPKRGLIRIGVFS